ncbi:hypothetical protein MUP32_04285 [Candidatus Microgenomates bacterium]|nr:hypothetical protein [Candidatus Microgenomates bacterium]
MRNLLIVMGIIILILLAVLIFFPNNKKVTNTNMQTANTATSDRDLAIEKGKQLFSQLKTKGTSLENGPCIAEEIIPDWCVDVAHDPRQEVDNQPENQCQSYRQGKTHHFVELDTEGNLIRAI